MNTDLLNKLTQFVAERGESILSDPKTVSNFLSDYPRIWEKKEKIALIKCLEFKFAQKLQNVNKEYRTNCKQKLAKELEDEGLDICLCKNTVELLATVLYGDENPPFPKPAPPPPKVAPAPPPPEATKPKPANNVNYGTFTDPRDGRVYKTVKIGNQVWLAENLAYEAEGSECYDIKYGRLYNWNVAMKACPPGWHLPSDDEWQTLVDSAGGEDIAGKRLKTKSGWRKNGNGTDDFGFAALPGGHGYFDGSVEDVGKDGYWWSSTEDGSDTAYRWNINYDYDILDEDDYDKGYLFSIRCIKD